MNKTQITELTRLGQVQVFLDSNAESLHPLNDGPARVELDEIVDAIREQNAAYDAATKQSRSCTAQLRGLRWQLRVRHLAPIVAVERAKAPHVPVTSAHRVPRKNASDFTLVAEATAIATAIFKDRRMYLRAGLPEDFAEQLAAATHELQSMKDAAASHNLDSADATLMIAELVRQGRAVVRLLGALVLARASRDHNTALAAAWRAASAVRR
jgi:hypothetical protein